MKTFIELIFNIVWGVIRDLIVIALFVIIALLLICTVFHINPYDIINFIKEYIWLN